ncbi:hypothetical protein HYS30_01100, partial [Candidatus Peregrinibacteria bacterium]|nr:hypothetical protein [Candidatus Peregrinibacteria bacterium]
PLTIPLAFLALAGSVGVGYVVVHARTEVEPVAAIEEHVPVVCCGDLDGGMEEARYATEEDAFYRGEKVL